MTLVEEPAAGGASKPKNDHRAAQDGSLAAETTKAAQGDQHAAKHPQAAPIHRTGMQLVHRPWLRCVAQQRVRGEAHDNQPSGQEQQPDSHKIRPAEPRAPTPPTAGTSVWCCTPLPTLGALSPGWASSVPTDPSFGGSRRYSTPPRGRCSSRSRTTCPRHPATTIASTSQATTPKTIQPAMPTPAPPTGARALQRTPATHPSGRCDVNATHLIRPDRSRHRRRRRRRRRVLAPSGS